MSKLHHRARAPAPQAYTYHVVDTRPSSTGSDTYTIQIRVDNRIADPIARIQQAVLTCNCRGWIYSSSDPKACTHTKELAYRLQVFRVEGIKRASAEAVVREEPWLPRVRAAHQIPEGETVTVEDLETRLVLRWGGQAAVIDDDVEAMQVRQVMRRPDESRFYAFDIGEWLREHPVAPRRLPPGAALAPGIAASQGRAATGGADLGRIGLIRGRFETPVVAYGRVPKRPADRQARFEAECGALAPGDRCEVTWQDADQTHAGTMTVTEFAAVLGLSEYGGLPREREHVERLVRLCGASLLNPPKPFSGLRPGGSPLYLFDHLIARAPIVGFTIDTARLIVDLWDAEACPDRDSIAARWGRDHATHFQNLVCVDLGPDRRPAELRLLRENEVQPTSRQALSLYAVAAAFLRRTGFNSEYPRTVVAIGHTPDTFGKTVFRERASDAFEEHLPEAIGEPAWRLSETGLRLLDLATRLWGFARGTGLPNPDDVEDLDRSLRMLRAVLPSLPMPPDVLGRGARARHAVREWMVAARRATANPRLRAPLGVGHAHIFPPDGDDSV